MPSKYLQVENTVSEKITWDKTFSRKPDKVTLQEHSVDERAEKPGFASGY